MPTILNLVSDSSLLLNSYGTVSIPSIPIILSRWCFTSTRGSFQLHKSILRAARGRNKPGLGRSGKLILESAFVIASRLKLLPEPAELVLRTFGGGIGGGRGFWKGFGGGGSGDWNRRRLKSGMFGILVICGAVALWLAMGKELALDARTFWGVLGIILLGLSLTRLRGIKDWILGFCCCSYALFVSKRYHFQISVRTHGSVKKNGKRKIKVF